MSDQQNVTASYYITESVKVEIETRAVQMDRSASWLVDRILSEWIAANPAPQVKVTKRTGKTDPLPQRG